MQDAVLAVIDPVIVAVLTMAAWIRQPSWLVRLVQSTVCVVAYTQLLIQFPNTRGWWFTFDIFYIAMNGAMALALGFRENIAWAYLATVAVSLVEYSYAVPGTNDLANRLYYIRMWSMTFTDAALALLLYLGHIGKPDKEKHDVRPNKASAQWWPRRTT